jgi:hypothetical protein
MKIYLNLNLLSLQSLFYDLYLNYYFIDLFVILTILPYFLVYLIIIHVCDGFVNCQSIFIIFLSDVLSSFIEKFCTAIFNLSNISSKSIKFNFLSVLIVALIEYIFVLSHSQCASSNFPGDMVFIALHDRVCIFIPFFPVLAMILSLCVGLQSGQRL